MMKKTCITVSVFLITYLYSMQLVPQEIANTNSEKRVDYNRIQTLSLHSAILLALYNNRDIRSAYLNRVSDRFNLRVARDLFIPDINIDIAKNINQQRARESEVGNDNASISSRLSVLVPTGGQLSMTWDNNFLQQNTGEENNFTSSNVNLSFIQPLLRGGGIKVTRASQDIAEISEKINILNLKNTIMNTVTAVILSYRGLLLQQQQLKLTKRSLERAKTLIHTTERLIKAGRTAPQDLVQAQVTLSQRELDLEGAKNLRDIARLSLLSVLDIDSETTFVLSGALNINEAIDLNTHSAFHLALNNQPSYLRSLLQTEISDISLHVAKNNRLVDLNLELSAGFNGDTRGNYSDALDVLTRDRADYRVGLVLTIPLGDRTRRANVVAAHVSRRQQELSLIETKEALRIAVANQLETLRSLKARVSLARKTETLTHRQLDIEKLKLERGRSTNFQVLDFEDQLINAQLNTTSLVAAYLNTLAQLDLTLGTTLDTWQIPFQVQRYHTRDLRSKNAFQRANQGDFNDI